MNLDYLGEFLVIAELKSFSRAAEELCITQSSLSKHIMALERELDIQLFQRTSRSVKLSSAGEKILPLARRLVDEGAELREIAKQHNLMEKTVVQIASIPVMAQYDITGMLSRFHQRHPGITLQINECEQREIAGLLENNECELAFMRLHGETDRSWEREEFCTDQLMAVLPLNHPFAGKSSLAVEELKHDPFLLMDQKTSLYDLSLALCQRAGFAPSVAYVGHRPETIVDLVSKGMGVSFLMERHLAAIPEKMVAALPLSPAVDSSIYLVRRRNETMSGAAKTFWNELKALRG